MRRPSSETFAKGAFVASLVIIATVYGVLAERFGWFPKPQIDTAEATVRDLSKFWKNDLGLEPARHIVPARVIREQPDEPDVRWLAPERKAPGLTLVATVNPNQAESFHVVVLYDEQHEELHRWPVRYQALDPEGLQPRHVMLHGMTVFEDGSLAVTFDAGNVIARIDACGDPLWTTSGEYHHSIERDGNGRLLVWRFEEINWIDEDSGEVLQTLSLQDQIMRAGGGQEGMFAIKASTVDAEGFLYEQDAFHTNDVEPLTAELADAFPMFETGDLLISLRELNMVAVIDPRNGLLKWYKIGPWHRQHDPDFNADGTITVLDNATGLGHSRIRRVDPRTDEVTDVFPVDEGLPFYSWQRGKHQMLSNGNVLVAETEHGRVFEAAPDGTLVWERDMRWNEDQNVVVTQAINLPTDFFADSVPRCGTVPTQ